MNKYFNLKKMYVSVQAKTESELSKVIEKIEKTQAQYEQVCADYQSKMDSEEMCSTRYTLTHMTHKHTREREHKRRKHCFL